MLPEWIRLKNPSKNRRFKKIERLSEPKALTIESALTLSNARYIARLH